MERGLILVAAVEILVCVVAAVLLAALLAGWQHWLELMMPAAAESGGGESAGATPRPTTGRQPGVCLTPGCLHAASEVLSKLDRSVDPCDDFYQYACGNYLLTTNVPDDKTSVGIVSSLEDQLLEELRNAIEEEDPQAAVPRSFQLARKLYSACTNKRLIESRGLAPLQSDLKRLGGWPVLEGEAWDEAGFDWKDSVHRFRRAGHSDANFIHFIIGADHRNSTRRRMYLKEASLGLDREFLVKGTSDKLVDAYYQYQVDLAVLLGADRARAERELKESLQFEIALASIPLPNQELGNLSLEYNPYTVEQLQREFPFVPWLEYLQALLPPQVTISSDELIIVKEPSYLRKLQVLLSNTPKRVMANYVMWRAVDESTSYMSEELRSRWLKYDAALTGRREWQFRWKVCLKEVADSMKLAVGVMYMRKYINQEAKQAAVQMVEDIRQELLRVLQEADWMDDGTRKEALEKVKTMATDIAHPNELLDDRKLDQYYEKLEMSPTMYLESALNLSRFRTDSTFSRLRQPVNKTEWTSHNRVVAVQAVYDYQENSIEIPVGTLKAPLFSADRPSYMNYGAVGYYIGFAMTSSFTDWGLQMDKDGNLVNSSDLGIQDKFLKRAQCLTSQYGNFTDEQTGLHVISVSTDGQTDLSLV